MPTVGVNYIIYYYIAQIARIQRIQCFHSNYAYKQNKKTVEINSSENGTERRKNLTVACPDCSRDAPAMTECDR